MDVILGSQLKDIDEIIHVQKEVVCVLDNPSS